MSNKTILVSNNEQNNTLTSFNKVDVSPYDNFRRQTSTFRRNSLKTKANEYEISSNPFLSSASPLIKYALEVTENDYEKVEIDEIRENCITKINLFGETALNYDIDNTEILVTRYILCTFVDELMNMKFSGNNNSWSSNSLLSIFHRETYGGENFFHLLDKFLKTSAKYIYILELMYICLALGFQGKYRVIDKGQVELNNIKDSLFKQIKIVQGRDPYTFYTYQEPSKDKYRLFNKTPYALIFSGIFLLISVIYFILTYALSGQNDDFLNLINSKEVVVNNLEGIK